ncbi:MAG: HAD family hydrolase [Promethearchaeota archaeon]
MIIFDFDGVLVDTKQSILYTFQKSLERQGYTYSIEEIEQIIGQRPEKVISDLIPQDDNIRREKIERANEEYDKILCSEEGLNKVKLLPSAIETVRTLSEKRFKLAIVTNQYRQIIKATLKHFSLGGYWDKIIAADDGFKSKVDAALFIINLYKITPQKTAYIGDMVKDIEVAKKVGCKMIAIPGWHSRAKLKKANPDYLINSLEELIS